MTDRTLQLYNSNRVYYALERDVTSSNSAPSEEASDIAKIDNPDQRCVCEDVLLNSAINSYLAHMYCFHFIANPKNHRRCPHLYCIQPPTFHHRRNLNH